MAMSEDEVRGLAGLTVEGADDRVTAKGSSVTIMSEGGTSFPVLTMYDINRVCFHVEKGKVVVATIG
jgi:hypothetical protein